jgi:hypothetical protein
VKLNLLIIAMPVPDGGRAPFVVAGQESGTP